MTLTDKIAALPEWPVEPVLIGPTAERDYYKRGQYEMARAEAALARLELAREWIKYRGHRHGCKWLRKDRVCTCGLFAALAALRRPE
jgi:hypothetical protein